MPKRTRSYHTTRTLLKAWSAGGVAAADSVMLDLTMELFLTDDCRMNLSLKIADALIAAAVAGVPGGHVIEAEHLAV